MASGEPSLTLAGLSLTEEAPPLPGLANLPRSWPTVSLPPWGPTSPYHRHLWALLFPSCRSYPEAKSDRAFSSTHPPAREEINILMICLKHVQERIF